MEFTHRSFPSNPKKIDRALNGRCLVDPDTGRVIGCAIHFGPLKLDCENPPFIQGYMPFRCEVPACVTRAEILIEK